MHAKNNEENIHAIQYLQEKLVVVVELNALLNFHALPFPSFSKTPSMPHSSRVLQENSKCSMTLLLFFPPFNLEYVSHDLALIFFPLLTFTWNFDQGYYKTIPHGGTPSSMLNDTYNQQDN